MGAKLKQEGRIDIETSWGGKKGQEFQLSKCCDLPVLANIRRNKWLGTQWAEMELPGSVAAPKGTATARAGRVCILLFTCSPATPNCSRVTPA